MEHEYFKNTRHGLVWARNATMTLRQSFALAWPKMITVVAGMYGAIGILLAYLGLLILSGRGTGSRGPYDTLTVVGIGVIGFVIMAIPTALARRTVRDMKKSRDFRFDDMLDGPLVSPSVSVLRAYEGVTRSFEKLSAGTQQQIAEWLDSTWEGDSKLVSEYRFYRQVGQQHLIDRDRWYAVRARIESFTALPGFGGEAGFTRVMEQLSEQYRAKAERAMVDYLDGRGSQVRYAEAQRVEAAELLADFRRDSSNVTDR